MTLPAATLPRFSAPYALGDEASVAALLPLVPLTPEARARIDARATRLVQRIRRESAGPIGGIDQLLLEYDLSTAEGLALMCLAEALLRVPDAATVDRLIEDKISGRDWGRDGGSLAVNVAGWALAIGSRLVRPGETPETLIGAMVTRMGDAAVRAAARQAMRVMGNHFVLGETIGGALDRAAPLERKGYRHSFDMLGEGARTEDDARRYWQSYADAIAAIGAKAQGKLPARPGISVKLSALHPRYEASHAARVRAELVPAVIELARRARAHDLNFTIDAEEADRLELSLEVIGLVLADPKLAGWDGFGLAIQAYQTRALAVIDHVAELGRALGRRLMLRLVKGAYWDSEIKRAQERGLVEYPVFTRKSGTDLSYLACARRLLSFGDRVYPQFATHNALTVAAILEFAGPRSDCEFQRLHGMGEALYREVTEGEAGIACRIYAPVGGHRDLLAYLVRRLLENGANSSFVHGAGDPDVPLAELLRHPQDLLPRPDLARHRAIPRPRDLYGPERPNPPGLEFGDRLAVAGLLAGVTRAATGPWHAAPTLPAGVAVAPRLVTSPVDGSPLGEVAEADPARVPEMIARAARAFPAWSATPVTDRAALLERVASLLEARRDPFLALLAREGGRTLLDGISEWREAIDFCRYYAAEARRVLAGEVALPGPTGERNTLRLRGRGPFACIAPWNFPLAIFTGQVAAALVAGNTVLAKPAEQTPLTGAAAIALFHEAGVPPEVLQLLPGDGRVGAALTRDPRLAGVAFTGSTATAWAINRALAARDAPIVPLIAETGGVNAMLVDATALPEQVTDDVLTSAFRSAGQRCSALRVLFVQEDVADRMIEMIVGAARELRLGDPLDPASDLGPVIDAEARAGLAAHIDAMAGGAARRVLLRQPVPKDLPEAGFWVAPQAFELARLSDLPGEVFGPVLHVVRYAADRFEDVLAAIEASGFGLTLGLHTRIDATVEAVARRLPVGNVYVNRSMIGAVVGVQPFGGMGLSGTGPKAGGPGYLPRFATEQVVSVNTAAAGGNASLIAMAGEVLPG